MVVSSFSKYNCAPLYVPDGEPTKIASGFKSGKPSPVTSQKAVGAVEDAPPLTPQKNLRRGSLPSPEHWRNFARSLLLVRVLYKSTDQKIDSLFG